MARNLCTLLFAMAIAMCGATFAVADPLDGRDVLKFQQRPMFDTVIPGDPVHYHGHDEFSTAYSTFDPNTNELIGYVGNYMADDFADEFKTPVVHVKWWGSYMNSPALAERVHRFLISFEEDVPVGDPNNTFPFSHPGKPLLNQIVSLDTDGVLTPGSGTFTETPFWPISVDGPIYEYNAELHLGKEFRQEPDTVRWLKIVALVDVPPVDPSPPIPPRLAWGWHNRDYTIHDPLASVPPGVVPGEFPDGVIGVPAIPIWHFQDDAVQGSLIVDLDPMMPNMPIVRQSNVYDPKNYEPLLDGPSIIAFHSKDLAFELYTIPEPNSVLLIAVAAVGLGLYRRRRP